MTDQESIDRWFNTTFVLTGSQIVGLMRKHKVTIREFKERTGITLKRIRHLRSRGKFVALRGHGAVDWIEHITGSLPEKAARAYKMRMES